MDSPNQNGCLRRGIFGSRQTGDINARQTLADHRHLREARTTYARTAIAKERRQSRKSGPGRWKDNRGAALGHKSRAADTLAFDAKMTEPFSQSKMPDCAAFVCSGCSILSKLPLDNEY